MSEPVVAYLGGGERLHLQHGPIDLIIGADADEVGAREQAFRAAAKRFDGLLESLVEELAFLRRQISSGTREPHGLVARRMTTAARAFYDGQFLTPMIAVAGSVADTILNEMVSNVPLQRAYVNNGGDIALHLQRGQKLSVAIAAHGGTDLGRIALRPEHGIGGIATSGTHGRSHSLGIADSVTVLAKDAASADVAATLIANAVDLPDHPAVRRTPAVDLSPDSDLQTRLVVTSVGALSQTECDKALSNGAIVAETMLNSSKIIGSALLLQGRSKVVGSMADQDRLIQKEPINA